MWRRLGEPCDPGGPAAASTPKRFRSRVTVHPAGSRLGCVWRRVTQTAAIRAQMASAPSTRRPACRPVVNALRVASESSPIAVWPAERTRRLIAIAHPSFREELISRARELGYLA
jgi:hypothetical protein